jgi:FSR family fosmidomycin resistance protein-like MFS transporter
VIGIIISSAFPAILVYAQELLPKKLGMVSGLLRFGMGGLGSALEILRIIPLYMSIIFVPLPLIGIIASFCRI